jgi:hypothetical protein
MDLFVALNDDMYGEIAKRLNKFDLYVVMSVSKYFKKIFWRFYTVLCPMGYYKTIKYLFGPSKMGNPSRVDMAFSTLYRVYDTMMVFCNLPWIVYMLGVDRAKMLITRMIEKNPYMTTENLVHSYLTAETTIDMIKSIVSSMPMGITDALKHFIHYSVKYGLRYPLAVLPRGCLGLIRPYQIRYGCEPTTSSEDNHFSNIEVPSTDDNRYTLTLPTSCAKRLTWTEVKRFSAISDDEMLMGYIKYKKYDEVKDYLSRVHYSNPDHPQIVIILKTGDPVVIKMIREKLNSPKPTTITHYKSSNVSRTDNNTFEYANTEDLVRLFIEFGYTWKPFGLVAHDKYSQRLFHYATISGENEYEPTMAGGQSGMFRGTYPEGQWYEINDDITVYRKLIALMVAGRCDDTRWKNILTPRVLDIAIARGIKLDRMNVLCNARLETVKYLVEKTKCIPLNCNEISLLQDMDDIDRIRLVTHLFSPPSSSINGNIIAKAKSIEIAEHFLEMGFSVPADLANFTFHLDHAKIEFCYKAFSSTGCKFYLTEHNIITLMKKDFGMLKKFLILPGCDVSRARGSKKCRIVLAEFYPKRK